MGFDAGSLCFDKTICNMITFSNNDTHLHIDEVIDRVWHCCPAESVSVAAFESVPHEWVGRSRVRTIFTHSPGQMDNLTGRKNNPVMFSGLVQVQFRGRKPAQTSD